MSKFRFADLNIEFLPPNKYLDYQLRDYSVVSENTDISLTISEVDMQFERKQKENLNTQKHDFFITNTVALRKIAEKLPFYDSAVFHSCAFAVDKKGVALTARSGTGKTTHMLLWKEMLGEKFNIVNGDKPFIRIIDDNLYVYGSPWAGKEGLNANISSPLTDICLISRSKTNFTEKLSKQEGIDILMQQIYMPLDVSARLKTLELIYKIAEKVNFWQINCNMEPEAAEVAYNAIFGKNQ